MVKKKLLFNVKDVMEMLGVSRPTIYAYMRTGVLPSGKLGGHRIFTRQHIRALENNLNNPPSSKPSSTQAA